jgi:TonB-dependent receptor
MSKHVSRFALATLIGAGFTSVAHADFISGKVTDSTGQAPLEGANVEIEGLNRSATTNRFGAYRIANVPSGNYTIVVSYIGTDTVTAQVSVPAAGATLDLTLGQDVRYLDNILVVGSSAAQAGALNQQRAADSIISVIDSDGLGNFPDTTVADSLARIPGLSIENDQGEGRYVSIRGINTDLIAASINGVRTPSPEDRRGVLLDGIPSDLLDGIEVQKSLTPDVDADSLGGVINLKTISAFDRDGRFIRAKFEGAYNEITEELSPKATFTYADTFNDTFGVALSLNYQDLRIEAHNNEAGEWGEVDGADFEIPVAGTFIVPTDNFENRWYDLTRQRLGIVANLDWRVNETTDLYLRTLSNQYTDDEVRNKFEFREMDEEIVAATATSATYRRGEVDAEVRQREEVRNIQTYALGGITRMNDWTFDYEASFAYAEEDDSNNHDVGFRSGPEQRDSAVGSITIDWSNAQSPLISGQALPFLLDPSNYEMDAFEREFTTNEDTEVAAQFNVSKEALIGDVPVSWKGGVKLRDRKKVRDQNLVFYERDAVNLSDFIRPNAQITNWRLTNQMYQWPDAGLTAALRNSFTADELDEEASFLESTVGDFTIEEQILAGYAMGTFDLNELTIVAGVRVEQTDTDLLGFFAVEGETTALSRNVSNDYTHVLPSLNLKYQFGDKLVGRGAYYAAVVRPSFGDMAPRVLLNADRNAAEIGNPNLDPYEADNFDIALEYYPTNLSVLSVGLFYKEIDNAIFPANYDIADVPANVDLSFLDATTLAGLEEIDTFINVGSTELSGIEVNYVQGLGDLTEALDGFLVSANLTLTDSESTLPDGRSVPFLKQSDTVWNLALGYDKGPWDLRISANFRGDYLDELVDADLDRTTDDRLLVEASAKYKVNDNLQLYVEGKNLTDEPEYYYFGDQRRLSQYDEFGTTFIFGARLTY